MRKRTKIKIDEYIGKIYNKLTIISDSSLYTETGRLLGDRKVKTLCECGTEKVIELYSLMSGHAKSCGCNQKIKKHGKTKTVEYKTWSRMKERCYNIKNKNYPLYGGRGIFVCDRWLDKDKGFLNFLEDMGERPSSKHSIDRIDVNGNYEPVNCRWATIEEQNRNKRNTIIVEYNGEMKCLKQHAEDQGIDYVTFLDRLKSHSFEKSLKTPVGELIPDRKMKMVNLENGEEEYFNSTKEARRKYSGAVYSANNKTIYKEKFRFYYI